MAFKKNRTINRPDSAHRLGCKPLFDFQPGLRAPRVRPGQVRPEKKWSVGSSVRKLPNANWKHTEIRCKHCLHHGCQLPYVVGASVWTATFVLPSIFVSWK